MGGDGASVRMCAAGMNQPALWHADCTEHLRLPGAVCWAASKPIYNLESWIHCLLLLAACLGLWLQLLQALHLAGCSFPSK